MSKTNTKTGFRSMFKKDAFTSHSWERLLRVAKKQINAELKDFQEQLDPGTYYLSDLLKLKRGGILHFGLKRRYFLLYMYGKISNKEYFRLMEPLGGVHSFYDVNVELPTGIFKDSSLDGMMIPFVNDMGIYSLWKLEARWEVPKKNRWRIDIPETRETVAEFEFSIEAIENRVKGALRVYASPALPISSMKGKFKFSTDDDKRGKIVFTPGAGRAMISSCIEDVNVNKGNPRDFDIFVKVKDSHYLKGRCKCSIAQWVERYSGINYKVQRTVITNAQGDITSYTSRMPQCGSQLITFDSKEKPLFRMPAIDIEKYACHVGDIYCQLDKNVKAESQNAMFLLSKLSPKQENIVNPFIPIIKSSLQGIDITFPNVEFASCASYEQLCVSKQHKLPFSSNYELPVKISSAQLRRLYLLTKLSIYQWTSKEDDGKWYLNTYVRSVHVKSEELDNYILKGGRAGSKAFFIHKYCYSQELMSKN